MADRHSDRAHPSRSGDIGKLSRSRSLRMCPCPCAHAIFGHEVMSWRGGGGILRSTLRRYDKDYCSNWEDSADICKFVPNCRRRVARHAPCEILGAALLFGSAAPTGWPRETCMHTSGAARLKTEYASEVLKAASMFPLLRIDHTHRLTNAKTPVRIFQSA